MISGGWRCEQDPCRVESTRTLLEGGVGREQKSYMHNIITVSPGLTTMTEASHPTALAASPEESGADVDAAHSACSTSRFDMMDFLESLSSTQVISHVSLPDAGACGLGVVGARTAGYGLGFPLERR